METKIIKAYDERNSHRSSKLLMIYISSDKVRHPATMKFTTLHYTSPSYTSLPLSTLHLFTFKLHKFTLLSLIIQLKII